jgi:hypothetical protein
MGTSLRPCFGLVFVASMLVNMIVMSVCVHDCDACEMIVMSVKI